MIAPTSLHTNASTSGMDSFRTLTQFLRDIDHPRSPLVLAEQILSNLSAASQYPHGTLYVIDQEHHCFRPLHTQGPVEALPIPPIVALDHPLIRNLARHQHILDATTLASLPDLACQDNSPAAMFGTLPYTLVIPLMTRGKLLAFALLQSQLKSPLLIPMTMELLSAMAQGAANALDSLLMYEDLRQSQALMRRTDRLRSLEIIAGGFAHEIRNPLTSIKTFIQLAPERKDDTHFIGEFSRIVLDDVNRIERLIQEILDYARYMEPQLTDEDLNDIVMSCLYFIQVKAERHGIKIEKELAPELPRGMLDRQQIKQVLLNLLLNAMDAIGEKPGIIRVRTHQLQKPEGDHWMQVEIEDTGHGIASENLEHIFDPFFTTKHTSTLNEGTGLGLTIAHQIIQEHRGEMHVSSEVGQGTTFRITLPTQRQ